uniref:Glycosyltransferase family 4 protein n=1 Tax=candidate division WOR-3 bacterium TaxID=2052148 RepID=A0A7C3J5Y9_UNCW3
MKKDKKVLLISHLWPKSPQRLTPSTGIYVYEQVEELRKLCEVKVFVPVRINPDLKEFFSFPFKGKKILEKFIFKFDSNFTFLKYPKIFSKHFDSFFISFYLYTKTREDRYDIIHSHTLFPDGFSSYIYSRLKRIPFVVTIHGSDLMFINRKPFDKFLVNFYLKKAKKVIVVSERMKGILENDFKIKNSIVVRNGIKEMFDMTDLSKNILFVGRLTEVKDPLIMIDIFYEFLKVRKDFKLKIVGDGPLKEKVLEKIKEYGIEKFVDFEGFVKREDIGKIYSKSFLTVITSRSEGFPTILFESFSAGLPVISFDVGGVKEVVKDYKTGFIIPKRDKSLFVEKLLDAVDFSWDRDFLRDFSSNFTWEKIVRKIFEEVY